MLWVIFYTFVRLCAEYKWYKGKDLQPRNTGAYADQSLTFPPRARCYPWSASDGERMT